MDLLKIIGNLQKLAKQMLKEGIILELPEVRQQVDQMVRTLLEVEQKKTGE
jgi:hypothetical protein